MALWESNKIIDINQGSVPNDGTGDNIRDAFIKVDDNFSNISSFLSSTTVGFLNANISNSITSTYATFTNSYTANTTGTTANFTANVTAANLIANTGIYSNGILNVTGNTNIQGNTFISGDIVPTAGGVYNLGSAARPFGTIYYTSAVTGGTVQTTDAGQLIVHANAAPGDIKDVGILGNITHHYESNTYAFFGYQYLTNNFIYKITNVDPTKGNSVVYNGIYGNTQFGSQFLSNTTTSTSPTTGALIVAGGAGVAGNLNVGGVTNVTGNTTVTGNIISSGNIYSNGWQVLTTNSTGFGQYWSDSMSLGSGQWTFPAAINSTSTGTGAVVLSNGGLGVYGNIYAGAFYGNLTGTLVTAAQPNITTVGSLNGLTISSGYNISTPDLQATTIGATNVTASTLNVTGSLTGLTSLTLVGNVTSNTAGFVGSLYGTVQTAAQSKITSLGALTSLAVDGGTRLGVTVANSFSTANAVISGGYISGLANVSATNSTMTTEVVTNFSSGNVRITGGYINSLANISATQATVTNFSTANAVISGGYISGLANVSATNSTMTTGVATNFSTANAVISGGYINSLANISATQATVTNFASGNAVISGGYINSLANISATQATITNFASGNAVISGGYISGLANVSATNSTTTTGVVTNFSSGNVRITGGYISGLANVAATNGYIGTVAASTVNAATIGNTGATLTGTLSTAAQTNITSVGTLTGLVVNNSSGSNVSITATGNIVVAASTTNGNGIFVTGNILPSANVTYNVGSSTQWFNTFYGKSTQAQYADLAEKYLTDVEYDVGTVVAVGGDAEVTASKWGDLAIGVVSTNPAYMMNSGLEGGTFIALKGRVPVKVIGAVTKGQRLIASDNGYAVAGVPHDNNVFGVALESSSDTGVKLIEAVIL